jgi:cyclic pyranopterin phosphate synthase
MKDKYGRSFQSLRVSLTNVCNMRCVYCVPESEFLPKKNGIDYRELAELVIKINQTIDLKDIRITGGEPSVHPNFIDFVQILAQNNLKNIKVTTNGLAIEPYITKLAELGVQEINFSVDSLDEDIFKQVSKQNNVHKVLDNIDLCLKNNIKVKVNTVLLKSLNDTQILPILEYFMERNISVRYLELMRMGHLFSKDFDRYFIGQEQILDTISDKYPIKSLGRSLSATAQYWQLENGYKFGIIANESVPFCNDCNRLRIDSKGHLYGCLSKNDFVDISQKESDLERALHTALKHKQAHKFTGSELSMLEIGG